MGQMLQHIGYGKKKELLDQALNICVMTEKKVVVTTRKEDASAAEFTDYLLHTIERIG
jgi:isocitrate dehydrogenase (NAD+)